MYKTIFPNHLLKYKKLYRPRFCRGGWNSCFPSPLHMFNVINRGVGLPGRALVIDIIKYNKNKNKNNITKQ